MNDESKQIKERGRYMRSRDEQNPPHTKTAYIPIYTPPDVRIGLTLMPARYIGRAALSTLTDGGFPESLKENITNRFTRPFVKRGVGKINALFADEKYAGDMRRMAGASKDNMISTLRSEESGKALYANVRKEMRNLGAAGDANNLIEYAVGHGNEGVKGRVTNYSKRSLQGNFNKLGFHYGYDLSLGLGSTFMSYQLNRRAEADMMHIYSEVVGYETGKSSRDITMRDIMESDNKIIQSTRRNYERKRAWRYGTDALFFLRVPFKWISASDLAIGAKGVMWFNDVWGRKPTMLESFIYFVNDKLNPEYGISDPISKGDIINFFQQYATKFEPNKAFHTLIATDPTDARVWAQAEPIFARITELMNLTYNYKHITELDDTTGHPVASANFTLPKFIYLLGHGLIDPNDPVKTLAFVEIANLHGMDAVKEVEAEFNKGVPLRELIDRYPVSLDALRQDLSDRPKEQAESSSPFGPGSLSDAVPASRVSDVADAGPLAIKEQQHAHA